MSEPGERRKPITAGELLDRLEQDPHYLDRQKSLRIQQELNSAKYQAAAAAVLDDLRAIGFPVAYIGELYRRKLNYASAIPVLLEWLPRMDDRYVKDDIIRALSVRWARPAAAKPLLAEFHRAANVPTGGIKWVIGNALSEVADDSVYDDIVAIVRDQRYGKAREMVVLALANMKNPAAINVLIELLGDEQVAGHAISALQKLAPIRARPHIEPFLTHPKTWWRNKAKAAIAKIDKKIAAGKA